MADGRSVPEASWEIVGLHVQRSVVPGGRIDIEFFLAGFGKPDDAKITYFVPPGFLSAKDLPPIYVAEPTSAPPAAPPGTKPSEPPSTPLATPPNPAAVTHHGPDTFSRVVKVRLKWFEPTDPSVAPAQTVQVHGEGRFRNAAPIYIWGEVSRGFPSGDLRIPAVLTYSTNGKIKTSRTDLVIHVRAFWERPWFQGLTIALAAAVLIASIVTIFR